MPKKPSIKVTRSTASASTVGVEYSGPTDKGSLGATDPTAIEVNVGKDHDSGPGMEVVVDDKKPGTLDATMGGAGYEDDGPFTLKQNSNKEFILYRARLDAQRALQEKIITLNNEKNITEQNWQAVMNAWVKEMDGLKSLESPNPAKHEQGYIDTFKSEGKEFYKSLDIKKEGNSLTVTGHDPKTNSAFAISSVFKSGKVSTQISNLTPMSLLTAIELQRSIAAKCGSNKIVVVSVTDKETLLETIQMIRSQNMTPELSPKVREQLRTYVSHELGEGAGVDAINAKMNEYLTKDYFMGVDPNSMKPINPAAQPPAPAPAPEAKKSPKASGEPPQKRPKV